ncbi:inaD-like protein isoform X2 [Argiope bruennichi]|uniref:inaD-like protein isoform X2 n=1 Tax=Argiope bruennichi TaxID=94029 RepID=UPI002495A39F|nr:inaD-like protein isoform X2 [Argiope bruennichi]
MPVSADTRQALKLLERIQLHLQESEAAQLNPTVGDDLNTLISVLDSPVFNSILNIQDSIHELKRQLHKHPSILPVDFDISPTTGELLLNLPAEPIPLQNSEDLYEPNSDAEQNYGYESHLAKSMGTMKIEDIEPHSTEISSMITAPPEYALSAITTESYAEEFQRTIDQGAQGREIHTLQLFKPEGSSLGFSVVGLRSEQKGELGIFIQEIQPNGIAGRDGRLQEGDQILAIDGQPLDSNISHQQAISILQQARGLVELIVARGGIATTEQSSLTAVSLERSPSAVSDASKGSDMVLNTEWAQVESIDLLNDGSGLGFGIIGGRSTGVVVKTILPGGVADRDGRLQSGDHILQIGEVNLRGMGSEQVAMVLRQSGSHVRLIVARPVDPASCASLRSHAPLVPTRILADPEEVEKHLAMFNLSEPTPYKGPPSGDATFAYSRELEYAEAAFSTTDGRAGVREKDLAEDQPEMETFEVELVKDQQGLGITIAGYVCEKEEISGIFVKSIAKGSAADMCGKIRVNDQIIEVDGRPLHGYTNHDAVEVLRSTGKSVKLRLARYLRGAKYQQLQLAIASGELSYPSLPSSVQAQIHEPKIAPELCTKDLDVNDVSLLVDNDFEGPLSPRVEAAIQTKWSKVMGPEFDIVVAQLSKFREGGGLGISLEGTVDVEDGKEVRPHHYIRSILPDGPVGVNGKLQGGDELLEVNGEKLLGMNHHGVVATLKELPLHVRMVCARRKAAAREVFPSLNQANFSNPYHMEYDLSTVPDFMGRGMLSGPFGGSLTSLTPTSERLVKAKSDGSLAIGTAASSPPMEAALSKLKSRSLEPLTGLAMWSSEPQIIELMKGDRGLGFSILDYQDPMNPNETVIVIRSLVPGGVAQQDGRLIPGDRLLFVNDINLENASLDAAVQALKGAPKGVVRIGVAKPLPLPESGQSGQISLENSPTIRDMKSSFELPLPPRLSLDLEQNLCQDLSETSVLPSINQKDNSNDFELSPVRTIRIQKGTNVFGLSVSIVESVGVLVTSVTPGSACDRDGRLKGGDILVSINGCSLLDAEPRIVGEILRNVDKSAIDVLVQYIPEDPSDPSTSETFTSLRGTSVKSDEEEDEYYDVSETEPPALPQSFPPTLVSITPGSPLLFSEKSSPELDRSLPEPEKTVPVAVPAVESKLSVIQLPPKPAITAPKPTVATVSALSVNPAAAKLLDVGSMVSKVKPTVPFKPIRTSLSPKDAFPSRAKSKPTTIESMLNETNSSSITRQWGPERTVELNRDPVKGLGISIISGKLDIMQGGIFIKNVLPDSPAGWNGTLKRGDRILEVSGVDIRNAGHAKAVDVIKNAPNPVKFIIQSLVPLPKKPEREALPVASPPSMPPPLEIAAADVLPKPPDAKLPPYKTPKEESPVLTPVTTSVSLETRSPTSSTSSSRESTIKRNSPKSSLEVTPTKPFPVSSTVTPSEETIQEVPDRPPSTTEDRLNCHEDAAEEVEADDKVPFDTLEEGKVLTRKGKKIDASSAGNVKLTPVERVSDPESEDEFGYTQKKIQKKYGDMKGELLLINLVKGSNKLGLSLAGNKDRTKMSVFVCGMHPKGMAAKDGRIKIGDELLEVNGVVVYGRCHLNASAMIKSLSGTSYKILLLRREGAIDEMAVKPLTQFPSELDEEATEDKYCHYRGMHTVTVRKAGLKVGDMILAANDADLVGADYDTAASILKQADGLLTLIVANPNKPSPGYIYDEEKKCPEIIENSHEKNVTLKMCEKKKDKSPPPLPPPKPSFLSPTKSSGQNVPALVTMPKPLETRTFNCSVAPLSSAAVISEVIVPSSAEEANGNDGLSFQEEDEQQPDPKKCEIKPGKETTIEITKEKIGLGLSIVGGSDTPLGAVIIHEVYPDGAAALDGRLRPGDQILEVNGEDLRDALHEHAITVLRQTPNLVQMVVYREEGQSHEEDAFETLDVELYKKPGRGLGLSIVGRKNGPGVFISEVVKGGIAEADGRLIQGDQILEVNGQDLKTATQEHAAAVLKTTMGRIHMKIGRLKAGSRRSTSCLTTTPKNQENIDSPEEIKTITLERGSTGLGFSIVGGYGTRHGDLPIYVSKLFEDGAAARDGQLKLGDQILSVNGQSLEGLTHQEAVEVLKKASGTVVLTVLQ